MMKPSVGVVAFGVIAVFLALSGGWAAYAGALCFAVLAGWYGARVRASWKRGDRQPGA